MSRQTDQRILTLAEELERLEQQITLTLQEIDSNFSKAHRIVTSSILPVIEDYAKHSNDVWESSKYWKQFFESAANVSLSGYEEAALDDEDTTAAEHTTTNSVTTPSHEKQLDAGNESDDDFTIDSPTQVSGAQSTPRLDNSGPRTIRSKLMPRSPSPRKYIGKSSSADEPSTPNPQESQFSSPFQQGSASKPAEHTKRDNVNPMLHRSVLDKNYRVLSTPFKQHAQVQQATAGTSTTVATTNIKAPWDDSPDSSPEMAAPQLRSELFSPPKQTAARPGPRTPGVSVQKPARNKAGVPVTSTGRKLFSKEDKVMHTKEQRPMYHFSRFDSDGEDEDDDSLGMSPPKTLQFHVPQSRLLQTPAREASKKIVEDLLATAGMTEDTTSDMDISEQPSPSVIRGLHDDDDTF